jgi:hypothetical protein
VFGGVLFERRAMSSGNHLAHLCAQCDVAADNNDYKASGEDVGSEVD